MNSVINKIQAHKSGMKKIKLKILRLNSNWANRIDLDGFFSIIDQLPLLEILDLFSCQSIRQLPGNIDVLQKFKKLDIDNNLLTGLPKALYGMHHLKTLRVSTNKIPFEETVRLKQALSATKVIT